MIDLHTHILFGWDDGAPTLQDSVAMLRLAAEDGIRIIAATPHYIWSGQRADPQMIRDRVAEMNAAVAEEGLGIKVITGCEVQGLWDHFNLIKHGLALTLGDSRAVLFEVPFRQHPVQYPDLLFQLRMAGFTPLLAHPERSEPFLKDNSLFPRIVSEEIPVQVTADSLTGRNGNAVKALAWKIVRQERPIVIASDAHRPDHRPPRLSDAHALLTEELGRDAADLMCRDNAAALLENRPPRIAAIERAKPESPPMGLRERLKRTLGRG